MIPLALLTQPAKAIVIVQEKDPVVATVGKEQIRKSEIDQLISTLPNNAQMLVNLVPEARQRLVKEYVEFRLLVAKAKQMGMNRTEEFKARTKVAVEKELMTMLLEKVKNQLFDNYKAPTVEEVDRFWAENKEEYKNREDAQVYLSREAEKKVLDDWIESLKKEFPVTIKEK